MPRVDPARTTGGGNIFFRAVFGGTSGSDWQWRHPRHNVLEHSFENVIVGEDRKRR
jgi:hypothetical protein